MKLDGQASESVIAMMVAARFFPWKSKKISKDLVNSLGVFCAPNSGASAHSVRLRKVRSKQVQVRPSPQKTSSAQVALTTQIPSNWHRKNYDMQLKVEN